MAHGWTNFLLILLLGGPGCVCAHDIPEVAREISRKDFNHEAWRDYVRGSDERFETWMGDNPSGCRKRFLDDNLLIRALGVPSGEIPNLKRFIHWLALYKEYHEPPPWYIRLLAKQHGPKFAGLLKDFSWEKFSNMIAKRTRETGVSNKGKLKDDLKALNRRRKTASLALASQEMTPPTLQEVGRNPPPAVTAPVCAAPALKPHTPHPGSPRPSPSARGESLAADIP